MSRSEQSEGGSEQSERRNQQLKPGKFIPFDLVNVALAGFISFIYSELARQSALDNIPHGQTGDFGLPRENASQLAAFSSYFDNFPLLIVFGYNLAGFIKETGHTPINLTGLLGLMPAVAGFTLGADGAKGAYDNVAFKWVGASVMAYAVFATRAVGSVRLIKKAKATFIEPWMKRRDHIEFNKQVLLDLMQSYPSYTINVIYADDSQTEIKDESIALIVGQVTKLRKNLNHSQKIHAIWDKARGLGTFCLAAGALGVIPLWRVIARKGWNNLHPGLGDQWYLREFTAIPHVMFYMESSTQFLYTIIDRMLMPMLLAFYNPKQGFCANLTRILLIPTTLYFAMKVFSWESGMSMSFEAQDIDLEDEMGGILAFLNPVYNKFVQFYAGSVVNDFSAAAFCVGVLAAIGPVTKLFDKFLRLIGAQSSEAESEGEALLGGGEAGTAVSKHKAMKMLEDLFDNVTTDKTGLATNIANELSGAGHRSRLSFLGIGLKSTYDGALQDPDVDEQPGCLQRVARCFGW